MAESVVQDLVAHENQYKMSQPSENESKAPNWSSKVLCRYYLHGVCYKGSNCKYSHDSATAKQSNVCTYYLKGACTYGSSCRYDHVKPKPKEASAQNTTISRISKPVNLPKEGKIDPVNKLVTLKKGFDNSTAEVQKQESVKEWVKAAEFVPGQIWQGSAPTSYVNAVQSGLEETEPSLPSKSTTAEPNGACSTAQLELCPYAAHGQCRFGDECPYFHGDICDICGLAVLLPDNTEQNENHKKECLKVLEEDMEESFALQRSKDKVCGICMEIVVEKKPDYQRRFGILSNCNHVFCLDCIRTWRQAKSFENKIVRSCPECRVKSDFVTPSKYWADDPGEKEKLIQGYKKALSDKPCKHFDQGRGECPFNAHCFYRHAYPDGRLASPKPVRRRRRADAHGNDLLEEPVFLSDFFEEHGREINDELEQIFIQLSLIHVLADSDFDYDSSDFELDEELGL